MTQHNNIRQIGDVLDQMMMDIENYGVDINTVKTEDKKKDIEDKSINVTWKPTHKVISEMLIGQYRKSFYLIVFQYLQWAELSFNPIVTGISLLVILSFCIWAISKPGKNYYLKKNCLILVLK